MTSWLSRNHGAFNVACKFCSYEPITFLCCQPFSSSMLGTLLHLIHHKLINTHCLSKTKSNLPRNLANNSRPLSLPLIPQSRIHKVRLEDQQGQVPHQGDGVKEVGVAAAGVQPQVVESGAQKGGVEEGREGWEGVAVG